jgi:hypothetical protein
MQPYLRAALPKPLAIGSSRPSPFAGALGHNQMPAFYLAGEPLQNPKCVDRDRSERTFQKKVQSGLTRTNMSVMHM